MSGGEKIIPDHLNHSQKITLFLFPIFYYNLAMFRQKIISILKTQFVCYIFTALIAFVIDFSLLYLLTTYLHIFYLLSATLSFLISAMANYLFSIKFVFCKRSSCKISTEICLFLLVTLIGLILNDLILWLITEKIGVFYLCSKIIAGLIVFFWSFFSRRYLFTKI